jgi:AmiR/NasT family two-component response regulator
MDGTELTNVVHRAAGMVAAQTHSTPPDALRLMEARARQTGNRIEGIAREVLERTLRFDA